MSAPASESADGSGRDRVLKMAHLARLKLEPSEVEAYSRQLDSILNYIHQLQSVDITGVEPLLSPVAREGAAVSPLREDRVSSAESQEPARVVNCSSETAGGAFVVPPVL